MQLKFYPQEMQVVSEWGEQYPTKIPGIITGYLESKRIFAGNYWNSYFIWANPQAKVYSDVVFETTTSELHTKWQFCLL